MATLKPRITVTLDPRLAETLKRMSSVTKVSQSSIVLDLLMAVHEPLMRTVALLEAAADAPEQVRAGLRDTADRLEQDLLEVAGHARIQLDLLEGLGLKGASDLAACLPQAVDEIPTPVSVTRGSGGVNRVRSRSSKAKTGKSGSGGKEVD